MSKPITTPRNTTVTYRVVQYLGRGREHTRGQFRHYADASREADRILAREPSAVIFVTR